jgi:hypothetical protein
MSKLDNLEYFNKVEAYLLRYPRTILNYLACNKLVSNSVLKSQKEIFNFFEIRLQEKESSLYLEWDQAPPGYFSVKFDTKNTYQPIKENILNSCKTKTRDYSDVIFVLSKQIGRFIDSYKDSKEINWEYISKETSIKWTNELLKEVRDLINWKYLYTNPSIKWNFDLLHENKDKIDWRKIVTKPQLFWTTEFIIEYKKYLHFTNLNIFFDGSRFTRYEYLTDNPMPYRYFNASISLARNVNWNYELIDRFKDIWDWNELSANSSIGWNEYLIGIFSEYISFKYLSINPDVIWSEYLIEKYAAKWDWNFLSGNPKLPWTFNFIKKYENKWTWKPDIHHDRLEYLEYDRNIGMRHRSISTNVGIVWDEKMISEWLEKIDLWRIAYLGKLRDDVILKFHEEFNKNELVDWRYDKFSDWSETVEIHRTGWGNLALNDNFFLTKKIVEFLSKTKITLKVPVGNFAYNGYYDQKEVCLLEILRNNPLKNITFQDIIENEEGWSNELLNEEFINDSIAERFIKPLFTEKYMLKFMECYNQKYIQNKKNDEKV